MLEALGVLEALVVLEVPGGLVVLESPRIKVVEGVVISEEVYPVVVPVKKDVYKININIT